MRIGFIGDVVGKPGRSIIAHHLPNIRASYGLDFVIANGENLSHGFGTTIKSAEELFSSGVDLLTGGNHTWDKREIIGYMRQESRLLRPLNHPEGTPGEGMRVQEICGHPVAVLNIMGHFAMPHVANAFLCARSSIETLRKEGIRHIIVDFHAEATSEKRGMFCLLQGVASAVLGTHTHVGTDDLEITSGTFGVSDVGATGVADGVIGMDKQAPLERFLTGLPARLEIPDKGKRALQMIIFELNESGECIDAFKLKAIDHAQPHVTLQAWKY